MATGFVKGFEVIPGQIVFSEIDTTGTTNQATFGDSPGSELFSAIENPPLQTTDATPTESLVAIYDMPDHTVADVLVTVVAKEHGSANCWRQDFRGMYAREGGPAALVGALVPGTPGGAGLAAAATLIVDASNKIRVEVTGVAATDISWSITMDVQPVTP